MLRKILLSVICITAAACSGRTASPDIIGDGIALAAHQLGNEVTTGRQSGRYSNPVTVGEDGSVRYCGYQDWRSGFFPGSLWYLYEMTGDEQMKAAAKIYTAGIEEAKNLTNHHDVGFIINSSFGNGLRIAGEDGYAHVMVRAAESLSTRFRPAAGVIQSWDVRGWQAERGWMCPVIIDNMMNLELLFKASLLSGDRRFYDIAVKHADRTLAEHFRPDGSCYHVVDYDPVSGAVHAKQTAQGYSDESVWSRGQAWAIYGFAMCCRYTGDSRYLEQALKTFAMMKNHRNMPQDKIPYWDMEAPNIPDEPRDVSTAACIASALYEISTMVTDYAESYKQYADDIMLALSSPAYSAKPDTNGNFILMHSVGSIPHGSEIDVPLNYADYYYLEALKRKHDIESGKGLSL